MPLVTIVGPNPATTPTPNDEPQAMIFPLTAPTNPSIKAITAIDFPP